jgi:hypothetical protein
MYSVPISSHRMSALYSDAVEPILIQVVPKYNPASYLEDTFATSMQVSRFTGFLNLRRV